MISGQKRICKNFQNNTEKVLQKLLLTDYNNSITNNNTNTEAETMENAISIKKRDLLKRLKKIYGEETIVEVHDYKNEDIYFGETSQKAYVVKSSARTTKFYKTQSGLDASGFLRTPEYIVSWSKGKCWK